MTEISKLTKAQKKTFTKEIESYGEPCDMVVEIRHDDECGNGHNTFSITANIYKRGQRSDRDYITGGCLHDEIEKHFPELAHCIKWHLCSTDGPLHYVANSLYHASSIDWKNDPREPNLEYARNSAIWPEAQLKDFTRENLEARLPALLTDFREFIESLGFEY